MIKNYLLIALRNFLRNKNYTLVNIFGLSIGLTSCIILYLLISFDLSFDNFHSKAGQIYRVVRESKSAQGIAYEAVTPYPFGNAFRADFTDVPLATQIHYHDKAFITVGVDKHEVESVVFADSLFFKVFDFGVLSGNPAVHLGEPNRAFVTRSLSEKFDLKQGSKFKLDNKIELEVVGVLEDVPSNSHINFTMVVSIPSFTQEFFGWPVDRWGLSSSGFSYIVLPENVSPSQIEERFVPFVKKYYDDAEEEKETYLLQPLTDIHYNTQYVAVPGEIENIKTSSLFVMAFLGLFILLIACINFVNLATALAIKKSKEIGIRKTLGAKRSQLTLYFLAETFLLTAIAVIISLCLVEWILPWLRIFVEKDIPYSLFSDPSLLLFLVSLTLIATFLSGFYPAIILSGFDPVAVLKNKINARGSSGAGVRKILVVCQFVIAQLMIIGTIVVTQQMNYLNSKPLGFATDAILNVPLPTNKPETLNNLRSRLENNPSINNVSFGFGAPTSRSNIGTSFFLEESGPTENFPVVVKTVDIHYKDTYELKMKAGRWFHESEEKMSMDTTLSSKERYVLILNETAAQKLGYSAEEILGKRVHIGLNDISAPVVGVTEDFHTYSLHEQIKPVVIIIFPQLHRDVGISINTANMQETVQFIQNVWTSLYPEEYFQYTFLDDHLAEHYKNEQRQLVLFRIFSGIAIFIACLGLLGLVSFMANQKLKEIGVRKVFGASVPGIVKIFSTEFFKLVLIAFLIASPLAWCLMNEWLQNFEYHISIHPIVYAMALLITLTIALGTVAYRSIRAALANPIASLRSE